MMPLGSPEHALHELGMVGNTGVSLRIMRIKETMPISIEAMGNIDQELLV